LVIAAQHNSQHNFAASSSHHVVSLVKVVRARRAKAGYGALGRMVGKRQYAGFSLA
jgi:hypothetical protein